MASTGPATQKFEDIRQKDALDYGNKSLQRQYITERLISGKAIRLSLCLLKKPVESALVESYRDSGYRDSGYRVLSLGCGPCCDVLGMVKAFQWAARKLKLEDLSAEFTLVDQFNWPLEEFNKRFDTIKDLLPGCKFQLSKGRNLAGLVECEMTKFLQGKDTPKGTYDFIVLSFVDVKSKLEFVAGQQLKQLLSPGGRIVVIDNNISALRSLVKKHDFRQSGLLKGKTICLQFVC